MKTLIAIWSLALAAGIVLWAFVGYMIADTLNKDYMKQSQEPMPDVRTFNPQETQMLQEIYDPQQRI